MRNRSADHRYSSNEFMPVIAKGRHSYMGPQTLTLILGNTRKPWYRRETAERGSK